MRIAGVLAILLGVGLTACGPSADPASSQGDTANVETKLEAKVATPLEARDALKRLSLFHSCLDPRDVSDGSGEVFAVRCYVADPAGGDNGSLARRQVLVFVSRVAVTPICERFVSTIAPGDFPVVTDGTTFVAFGSMNDLDLDRTWKWPDEVWPEDIARVLGGEVVTLSEWCPNYK